MYNSVYYNPLPEEFDLVYCHFPDRRRLPSVPLLEDLIPYNDPHYCMVLGLVEGNDDIIVVYGTSKIKSPKPCDFILEKKDLAGTGLIVDTKWSFTPSNIAILPYNKTYFSIKNSSLPTVGKFPESKKEDLLKIINHNNVQNILNDLYDSPYAMLPEKYWDLEKYKV